MRTDGSSEVSRLSTDAEHRAKSLPELYERLKEVALLCLEEQKHPDVELRFIGVQNIDLPAHA